MATFEITLLFLGSIIGAGFATGAEIVTFFGHLQLPVWCIAIIVGLLMFAIITIEIFLHYPKCNPLNQQISVHNHQIPNFNQQLLSKTTPSCQKVTNFLDVVFVMIYQILFTAMTAGVIQITNIATGIISLIISIFITLFGFKILSHFNVYIVSIIIILIISTALPHLSTQPIIATQWHHIPSALFWALLYAGLNCFMFPELITAAAQNHSRRTLLRAGAITAILVTILVGLILSTIKSTNTQTAYIPMLAAAPTSITTIVILLAILTSQYAALFAIMHRIQKLFPSTTKKPLFVAILVSLIAFSGSFCGFNQIIKVCYPLIGVFTCVYLLISFLARALHFPQHHSL